MDTYILTYKGNTVLWVCVHLCITCQERVKNGVHSGYGVGSRMGSDEVGPGSPEVRKSGGYRKA